MTCEDLRATFHAERENGLRGDVCARRCVTRVARGLANGPARSGWIGPYAECHQRFVRTLGEQFPTRSAWSKVRTVDSEVDPSVVDGVKARVRGNLEDGRIGRKAKRRSSSSARKYFRGAEGRNKRCVVFRRGDNPVNE